MSNAWSKQRVSLTVNSTSFEGVVVIMGVAGCGKSSIGQLLAGRLEAPMCEADELHPASNIERMSKGIPLTDDDRAPWLDRVVEKSSELCTTHTRCVVACSALRKSYRDRLRAAHARVLFVHLDGPRALIERRMQQRKGHFMPIALLDSQFETLEAPGGEADAITVKNDYEPEKIVDHVVSELMRQAKAETT